MGNAGTRRQGPGMQDGASGRRLDRLEEQTYFQERNLGQLHEALLTQQKAIDQLERRLAEAESTIAALRELLQDGGENALPPHFMPERY